jgi:ABC-type amino acid transport substrate-binding protein
MDLRMEAGFRMMRPLLRPLASVLLIAGVTALPAVEAQHRQVTVGVYANEPKIMLGQDGKLSGILGELLNDIARQEDWQLIPRHCEWQTCLELTQNGEIDLLPDVAFSDSRAQVLDFHQTPSLLSWSQLFSSEHIHL